MALAQPVHPQLAHPPPAPTELAALVPPRRALLPPAPTVPRQPALPRPAQVRMALAQPAHLQLVRARMALPRLALLPPVHPRRALLPPAPTELAPPAPPRLAHLPPVHPQLAPTVLAHPVRLLPPELPRAARMVPLLATVLLAAPPLLPCATTVWVSAVHRLRLLRRRSPSILTRYSPVRATISVPRRTRSIRTLAATRRAWIMWMSSPVISTRFPTASTILSKPQVVLTAASPTELRRVTPSNRNPLLRATECLRGSLMILTVLALIVP